MAEAQTIPDTLRGSTEDQAFDIGALWSPRFPGADLVDTAAALIPDQVCGQVQEGPSWRISVSPGRVRVWTKDEADAERTDNRERDLRMKAADAMAAFMELGDDGDLIEDVPERTPSRVISEWSRKSRANMIGVLADLDFAPLFADPRRIPGMVTLTYPGCWLTVAPNGKAVKKHMKALRKRFLRKFGADLGCIWKLEFQGRREWAWQDGQQVYNWCRCSVCDGRDDGRAPHVHMLMCPPNADKNGTPVNFREWLSTTWAAIVDHPDPEQRKRHLNAGTRIDFAEGMRAADPRRVVTYFAKHGNAKAKEYQHLVPTAWTEDPEDGPGRFWGYWGLKPKVATAAVSPETGTQAGRILRRHSNAQQVTRETKRPRTRGGRAIPKYPDVIGLAGAWLMESRETAKVQKRRSRTRAVRAKNGRGWSVLNDGARFGIEMAVALQQGIEVRHAAEDRAELQRCGLWDTPLARARRLAPGPRRDALIARLTSRFAH